VATRAEVEASILYAIDEASANWAGTTGLHDMVEAAYGAGWDLLIAKYEDYATTFVDFTIAGGASSWTLLVDSAPAAGQLLRTSFYKLRKLMRKGTVDGKYRAINNFDLEEAGDFEGDVGYMFLSDVLYIEPTADAPGDYRAWYVQQTTALSADGSVLIDPVNGGIRQYVIDVVCARLKAKDELSNSAFVKFAEALEERVSKMASHRDGKSRRIPDVRTRLSPRYRTRRWV
jgi:hypothetical protein